VPANLRIGVRLLASALLFVGVSFVFAFFYLKALNSNHDFHPAGTNPPQGYGIAILVCVLGAAAAFWYARGRLAAGAPGGWRAGAIAALVITVAAIVLQLIEYHELSFKTASGGYASVFWGFTLILLVIWLGALYAVETLVARTLRGGDAVMESLQPSADASVVYLATAAGIEIVAYVLLYLVK
jgi:heme/copper-type cytochrome/quinol oxidase subunit 3